MKKTIKNHRLIKNIAEKFGDVAESTYKDILDDYGDISAREEGITEQSRGDFNRNFMKKLKDEFDDYNLNGIAVKIVTFTKKQEKENGADFVINLNISINGKKTLKAFLVQAKIADSKGKEASFNTNKNKIIKQCNDMLNFTSDSFVCLYTKNGFYFIPAYQILTIDSGAIKTEDFFYHKTKTFFYEFFKCFIGDHKIAFDISITNDFNEYTKRLNVNNVINILINDES